MNEPAPKDGKTRTIPLVEAVGAVLAHDITEIRPGNFKGAAFKKGHVVAPEDLEHLARLGKQHLFVLKVPPGMMHEDEAVLVLAQSLAGEGIRFDPNPSEGKINLLAAHDGLLKVNVEALTAFNLVEGVMCASRHGNTVVKEGDLVAGTRAIPLVIASEAVEQAASVVPPGQGVFSVRTLARPTAGVLVTGNEIYEGLIEDRSASKIGPKLAAYGCHVLPPQFVPDDPQVIANAINDFIKQGAELIVATGGMSVDPDDVTRLGVETAGATELLYGSSVLPGAMLLVAKVGGADVIGVPACVIFHEWTIFDVVLPRVLAGESLTRRDMAELAHGGLCLGCEVCHYPRCSFGK